MYEAPFHLDFVAIPIIHVITLNLLDMIIELHFNGIESFTVMIIKNNGKSLVGNNIAF